MADPAAVAAQPPARRELAIEQAHIDRAYAALDRLREGADAAGPDVVAQDEGGGGTFQERFERERLLVDARRRIGELRWGDPPLVFGRIDFHPDVQQGDRFHVGRIGVFDEHNDQLVVDWRAPVAEGFYRATRAQPLGLTRRRSFHCRGRRLLGIDDVVLDASAVDADDVVIGEGALLAALSAPRTGRMSDAVATVQAEQDEVIRAPMTGITIVQGAAGTGKTVVALHRAAYLLYTFRDVLDRQGVLVLGPNRRFLDYVRDVLPALGEHEARLATTADLYPGVRPRPEDPEVARVKAGLEMARVLRRAVRMRQRSVRRRVEVPVGRFVLKLEAAVVNEVVAGVRDLAGTHNWRRRFVEHDLADHFHDEFRRRNTAPVHRMGDLDRHEFGRILTHTPAFRELLEKVWPLLSPQALLHDLLGSQAMLAHAARRDLLPECDWRLLHRARARRDDDVAWTDADVPLLHEAFSLLGPLPTVAGPSTEPTEDEQFLVDRVIEGVRASLPQGMDAVMEADLAASVLDEIRVDTGTAPARVAPVPVPGVWGSVLVDEAQDLSPMEWRMVARTCPNQAITIVGDLAQGTRPWSPGSWDAVAGWLGARRPPRRHELHINYRTPVEIMAWATPFAASPDSAVAVRTTGRAPRAVPVTAGLLVPVAVDAAAGLRRELDSGELGGGELGEGTVAVIAPETHGEALTVALAAAGLDDAVEVHAPESAKGLEFDAVVVVAPDVLAAGPAGTAPLYIALTRATTALVVVHDAPLPPALAARV